MDTCLDECDCDWEDENDPCWDGCVVCWDPQDCFSLSDWGENDEWASEVEAMECWVETNPCHVECDDLPVPDEECLDCAMEE